MIQHLILAILWSVQRDRLFCSVKSSLYIVGIAHMQDIAENGGDICLTCFGVFQCHALTACMQHACAFYCCLVSVCMQRVVHLGLVSGFVSVWVLWLVVEEGWAEQPESYFHNFIRTLQWDCQSPLSSDHQRIYIFLQNTSQWHMKCITLVRMSSRISTIFCFCRACEVTRHNRTR